MATTRLNSLRNGDIVYHDSVDAFRYSMQHRYFAVTDGIQTYKFEVVHYAGRDCAVISGHYFDHIPTLRRYSPVGVDYRTDSVFFRLEYVQQAVEENRYHNMRNQMSQYGYNRVVPDNYYAQFDEAVEKKIEPPIEKKTKADKRTKFQDSVRKLFWERRKTNKELQL